MWVGETGNGWKCKRCVWLSANRRWEPKKYVVERAVVKKKEVLRARDEDAWERCLEV